MANPVLPTGGGFGTSKVDEDTNDYVKYFADDKKSVEARKKDYTTMVNHYYDLVTTFFEYGWGQSFHFAPRFKGESFECSIKRYEHLMAMKIHAEPDHKVIDIGCGVGGPLREISQFTGAKVTGLNNNAYQIKRAEEKTKMAGIKTASWIKGDFMNIPVADNSFDGAYAFEATCHAPDKVKCFKEIMRIVKPGGYFATAEWGMTEGYDPNNKEHRAIKLSIEVGDGLPSMPYCSEIAECMKEAGWELVEATDLAKDQYHSWYEPLEGAGWGLTDILKAPWGRWFTTKMVGWLEFFRLAPRGTVHVNAVLNEAADALVKSGQKDIFSPMFLVVGRKPVR